MGETGCLPVFPVLVVLKTTIATLEITNYRCHTDKPLDVQIAGSSLPIFTDKISQAVPVGVYLGLDHISETREISDISTDNKTNLPCVRIGLPGRLSSTSLVAEKVIC